MGGSISKKASRSWEGACTTRPCAKRLKAALPKLVDSMERHGHLSPGPAVRDRLLKPIRATAPATGGGPHGSQTEIRPREEVGAASHEPAAVNPVHQGGDTASKVKRGPRNGPPGGLTPKK